jgi:Cd2+/Zn2+-exporting ATPase
MRISRQNLIFSVALLAVLIPSAVVGFLTVVAAVLVHEVSELLAVGNGVRAAKREPLPRAPVFRFPSRR